MKLDTRMSLSDFTKDLKEACERRLNLVKRLAGTNWGAEKGVLRQLYIGYIRAKLDYCNPIQNVANKNKGERKSCKQTLKCKIFQKLLDLLYVKRISRHTWQLLCSGLLAK